MGKAPGRKPGAPAPPRTRRRHSTVEDPRMGWVRTKPIQSFVLYLSDALDAVVEIGGAKAGDKTMIDTLEPAARSAAASLDAGLELPDVVDAMICAAEAGYLSTKGMVAKVGRSSRLGERSLGVLDAGAASCFLLLKSMGETMKELCR